MFLQIASYLRRKLSIVAALVVSLVLATSIASIARADNEGLEITMSPTSIRLQLKPGDTKTGKFTVLNSGSEAFDFNVYAAPYQVSGEAYNPVFTEETPRTQISRWVSFETETYHLEPRESVEVIFNIQVPNSIPEGGQYGVIFAETTGETTVNTDGTAITSKKRVGTLLYASADGKTVEAGSLLDTKVEFFQTDLPITVSQRVENTGNTDFMSETTIKVLDVFGNQVATYKNEHVILPNTVRAINHDVEGTFFAVGLYKVVTEANFLGAPVKSSHWVLILPFWAITVAVIVISLITIGVVRASRRRKHHSKRS